LSEPGAAAILVSPFRVNSALLTDLYQLTMACAYWKSGTAEHEAVFHLSFRRLPFRGGYVIACGLDAAITWLESLRFSADDLAYLATLSGTGGRALFERGFLEMLQDFRWAGDLDAVPEGTVVFPNEPLLRIRGPLLHCQLAETALLNFVNFQSLIATKAARICQAAHGAPVIEFGLRRAQGPDGALSASRAAFIGGCAATSNVLAGQRFGIPVKGTHAHSWVMSFEDERAAFQAYAKAMPHNAIFLVDTYDTLEGVRHAIEAGRTLRAAGHDLAGIRLDSGDLAWLSQEARRLLDEAGFPDASIIASNDLDETTIASLGEQGAAITVWGVGTRLVTAFDEPALGGVYKLSALRLPGGEWQHKIKTSDESAKASIPGIQQIRRFTCDGEFLGDAIYDALDSEPQERRIIDPQDATRQKTFPNDAAHEDLLMPIFRGGRRVYSTPPLNEIRERTQRQLAALHPTIRRFLNPHRYPAGLDPRLHARRCQLIAAARNANVHSHNESVASDRRAK
jgi:nicotinate phosphoribosyltransferase